MLVVQDDLKDHQKAVVDALLKVIAAPEPYPSPGRPIRQLVSQCLLHIYSKGDTRTLFDSVQALLKILVDTKVVAKDAYKVYVFPLEFSTYNSDTEFLQRRPVLHRGAYEDLRKPSAFLRLFGVKTLTSV